MKASTRRALSEIRTNPAAGTEDRLSRIWRRALNEPESDNDMSTQPGLISSMTGMHDNALELGHWMTHEPGHSGLCVYQN